MDELITLLNKIEDAYYDFVSAMVRYAEKKPERLVRLLNFVKSGLPDLTSADVIEFVSGQPDFYEDAAYVRPKTSDGVYESRFLKQN